MRIQWRFDEKEKGKRKKLTDAWNNGIMGKKRQKIKEREQVIRVAKHRRCLIIVENGDSHEFVHPRRGWITGVALNKGKSKKEKVKRKKEKRKKKNRPKFHHSRGV